MKVTENLVEELAHLSRLSFENEAKQEIISDLNKLLAFVEKLDEVDTEGIEPLIYMVDEVNVLRPDVQNQTISHEDGLKNGPKHDADFFRVPRFVGE
jgi:aspartyl-tRNA(Asn)/glutamyl-tRNA(Gln) amidotransferase subunit C